MTIILFLYMNVHSNGQLITVNPYTTEVKIIQLRTLRSALTRPKKDSVQSVESAHGKACRRGLALHLFLIKMNFAVYLGLFV